MSEKFKITVTAEWRDSQKKANSRSSLVYRLSVGGSPIDWQSEKVISVDTLKKLFDDMSDANGLTLLMEMHFASMLFPKGREITSLSIDVAEWSATKGDPVILTAKCSSLKVLQVMPLTANIVEMAKKKFVDLDEDLNGTQIVTLTTQQRFTTTKS